MTGHECKKALAEGKTICGTLIVTPSPKWLKYIDMGSIDRQIEWAKKTGMNLLFHSGDMYLFLDTLRHDMLKFRNELKIPFLEKSITIDASSE